LIADTAAMKMLFCANSTNHDRDQQRRQQGEAADQAGANLQAGV
jgi:hypothetical protein